MSSSPEQPEWSRDAVRAVQHQLSRSGCIRARLTLAGVDAGGRRHPVIAGWTTAWEIGNEADGHRPDNDAMVIPEDSPTVEAGTTSDVRLFPTFPQRWSNVRTGDVIRMRDGRRVIGSAVVLELVGPTNDHLIGRWAMFSEVRLRRDVDGISAGSIGAVVDVYEDAYEVEVVGDEGESLLLAAVPDSDLELVAEPTAEPMTARRSDPETHREPTRGRA